MQSVSLFIKLYEQQSEEGTKAMENIQATACEATVVRRCPKELSNCHAGLTLGSHDLSTKRNERNVKLCEKM